MTVILMMLLLMMMMVMMIGGDVSVAQTIPIPKRSWGVGFLRSVFGPWESPGARC